MSEQKQLTVAEILAKAQQENPEAGTRRRRRRSLEDGGVSVAELTGSLKKVEAKPVESRHSSVPIDAPEPKVEKPKTEVPKVPGSTRYSAPAPKEATPKAAAPKAEAPKAAAPKVEAPKAEAAKPAREEQTGEETTVLRKVAAPEPERVDRVEPVAEAKEPAPSMAETSPNAVPVVEVPVEDTDPVEVTEPADELDEFLEPETVPADEIVVEEEGVNPILLVLLVFLGVLVGVAGFLLFQWLWANTSAILAAVLGIAAVAGAIFGARALGTGRDWLTTALAGIAAIVVAFGPALL
ncbi:hypothetical protein V6D40_07525 [Corynebacterium sp. Q4381]|uniref:hypothetical protein n=1 Tax=Corynebacterium sp. Marseille-Q4381 TaxID=3121597 RepID=UPI002FE5A476